MTLSEESGMFADTLGSQDSSGIFIRAEQLVLLNSSVRANVFGSGQGGNVTIETGQLLGQNGARLSTNTQGEGKGGTVTIRASDSVAFEGESSTGYQSGIFSVVEPNATGDGGGIEIETTSLTLKDGARVYASTQGAGKGGAVTIRASDSVAFEGESPLGYQSGIFICLVELPETVIAPATLIAQNPCSRGRESEFVIAGRGGLPPNPNDILSSEATGVGLVEPAPISSAGILPAPTGEQNSAGILPTRAGEKTGSTLSTTKAITPAQGWIFNNKGEVVLTAYNPTVTGPQRLRENLGGCPTP